ncbi:Uu.00g135520.m01.CDS01 [Anthostomella pinea]|uniref:Uu.00g135520.m01.CDS01 n=1 Tax=Anthostomella pinea TaxID=933095 RepID=A0AAI8VP66_9PEZI|nr:Uu.00g135520.m01.CDS01 [Anthostomella pinea]
MVTPPRQSRLLSLPPAIRAQIYEYCAATYIIADVGSTPWPAAYAIPGQKYTDYPALLRTCKFIAREARSILYQDVRIRFISGFYWKCKSRASLAAVGTFAPLAIRNLFIELDVNYRAKPFVTDLVAIFKACKNIEYVDLHISPEFDRQRSYPAQRPGRSSMGAKGYEAFLLFLQTKPKLEMFVLRGSYSKPLAEFMRHGLEVEGIIGDSE